MKQLFFMLLLVGSFFEIQAQENCIIKGRITSLNGEAIPYASIYITSIARGSMANINGEYSLNIPCGSYKITFGSLGYETKMVSKDFSGNEAVDIQLNSISYQLAAVNIDPSSEDIAYNFIRKATAMAEYYKQQINAYQCKIYTRSFFDLNDVPWLLKKTISEEELKEMKNGFIKETVLKYEYEKPDKIKETIIAEKSPRSDTSSLKTEYLNLNFYTLGGKGVINPLSRNAFKVYEFEHIQTYYEGNQAIHKIKVIPKRKGHDLMKGHLYINDKLWNINHVDVSFEQPSAKVHYQQSYNEVQTNVWMPINHQLKIQLKLVGFQFNLNYLASISELSVQVDSIVNERIIKNLNLSKTTTISGEEKQTDLIPIKKTKTEQKVLEIIQKEQLSKKESLQLIRLVKRQEKELKKTNNSLTLEVSSDHEKIYADSALLKKKEFWDANRVIPLSEQEQVSLDSDSLNKTREDSLNDSKHNLLKEIFTFNGSVKSKNQHIQFQPKGILKGLEGGFNTVDGFYIKKELFTYQWDDKVGKQFDFTPWLSYAFSRESLLGGINFSSQYNQEKRAGFFFSLGRNSIDFNQEDPLDAVINSISTLLFKENYKKYYQSDYFTFGHQFDITNGLQLVTKLHYDERSELENNSSLSWSDRSKAYSSNIPDNPYLFPEFVTLDNHTAVRIEAVLAYTPQQTFQYKNGIKKMLSSAYPTFEVSYQAGIDEVLNSDVAFNFLSLAIKQSTPLQLIDQLSYHFEAGAFLDKNQLFFADYKSFNVQPFIIMNADKTNSFKLIDSYEFNTNDYYFEGHVTITDNHLLLKRLPFLNERALTETIYLNHLLTEQRINYTEFGYSLNRIFLSFSAGIFIGLEDGNYKDFGIRIEKRGIIN